MILATKIIQLRKKNGWTQEDLAEQMHVSRQSISKWESARSLPDLTRIIEMSDLFGVSADVLLRDDLDVDSDIGATETTRETSATAHTRLVDLEEVTAYIDARHRAAPLIALGVVGCILAAIPVILGDVLVSRLGVRVDGSTAGVMVAVVIVAAAVVAFLTVAHAMRPYAWVREGGFELGYGVDGALRQRLVADQNHHQRALLAGVVMCIGAVLWILAIALLPEAAAGDGELGFLCGAIVTVACGVYLLVRRGVMLAAYERLLEPPATKRERRVLDTFSTVYWLSVLTLYLAYSFLVRGGWSHSWVVWPIAAVAHGAVEAVVMAVYRRLSRDDA